MTVNVFGLCDLADEAVGSLSETQAMRSSIRVTGLLSGVSSTRAIILESKT